MRVYSKDGWNNGGLRFGFVCNVQFFVWGHVQVSLLFSQAGEGLTPVLDVWCHAQREEKGEEEMVDLAQSPKSRALSAQQTNLDWLSYADRFLRPFTIFAPKDSQYNGNSAQMLQTEVRPL